MINNIRIPICIINFCDEYTYFSGKMNDYVWIDTLIFHLRHALKLKIFYLADNELKFIILKYIRIKYEISFNNFVEDLHDLRVFGIFLKMEKLKIIEQKNFLNFNNKSEIPFCYKKQEFISNFEFYLRKQIDFNTNLNLKVYNYEIIQDFYKCLGYKSLESNLLYKLLKKYILKNFCNNNIIELNKIRSKSKNKPAYYKGLYLIQYKT